MLLVFVITTFNNSTSIARAIESLKIVKRFDSTILLIDDCSTDSTVRIAQESGVVDEIIKKRVNRGVANSRNLGIEYAILKKAGHIIFIDADDYFTGNEFSIFDGLDLNVDLYLCNYRISIDGEVPREAVNQNYCTGHIDLSNYIKEYCKGPNIHGLFSTCWAKIISVEYLAKSNIRFDESLKICEDTEFMFKCIAHTKRTNFLSTAFYVYTISSNSKSRGTLGPGLEIEDFFSFRRIIKALVRLRRSYMHTVTLEDVRRFFAIYAVIYSVRAGTKVTSVADFFRYLSTIRKEYKRRSLINSFKHYEGSSVTGKYFMVACVKLKLHTLLALYMLLKSRIRYG